MKELPTVLKLPRNNSQLHKYVQDVFGLYIPKKIVVPGHKSPFDFLSDVFFERVKKCIAIANRDSGKTQIFGLIHALNCNFKKNCETATAGAIKEQALKCYQYFKRAIKPYEKLGRVKFAQTTKAEFEHPINSLISILTATMNSFNSPHPNKAALDEFELVPWNIFMEFLNMTSSSRGNAAQVFLASTRKFPYGTVERLLSQREEMGFELYLWSIWETGKTCKKKDCSGCDKYIKGKMPDGTPRTFSKICNGKLRESDGFKPISDIIHHKFLTLDSKVWDAQQECLKAQTDASIFYWYDSAINYREFDVPSPNSKSENINWYLGIDFGGADPNVCLFVFEKDNVFHIFDEIYKTQITLSTFVNMIFEKMEFWGLNRHINLESFPDPSNKLGKLELEEGINKRGFIHFQVQKADNEIESGLNLLNSLGEDNRILIHKRCKNSDFEFKGYSRRPETSFSGAGKPIDKNNHAIDAFRYIVNTIKPEIDGQKRIDALEYQVDMITGEGMNSYLRREPTERAFNFFDDFSASSLIGSSSSSFIDFNERW